MARILNQKKWAVAIILISCLIATFGSAQSEELAESDSESFDEAMDELSVDVTSSIGDAIEKRVLHITGDLRIGDLFVGDDFQDVTFGKADALRARWRIRSSWGMTERLRGVLRVSGLCSTKECSPDFIFQPNIPTATSTTDGQITIDELFLQRFRSGRFNLAIGRMQTKFIARGGVFSKSLDQNNSPNLRINWTDGIHTTYKASNGWESHLVLQYNSKDGPSTVRRDPLDFSDNRSRVSYLIGFESLQEKRLLVQRAIDVNYYPSTLLTDGRVNGPLEDYWGIVVRAANRWPVRSEGWRIRLSTELGYAPNTPTKTAIGLNGVGDTGGLAWNITASVMDFAPNHSIGINYAQTDAGWLLSPQYKNNQTLSEIRYMWRPNSRMTMDVRGRFRYEIQQLIIEDVDRNHFDFYIRFTWSFDVKKS